MNFDIILPEIPVHIGFSSENCTISEGSGIALACFEVLYSGPLREYAVVFVTNRDGTAVSRREQNGKYVRFGSIDQDVHKHAQMHMVWLHSLSFIALEREKNVQNCTQIHTH